MNNPPVVLPILLIAVVLVVSGIAKLSARQETADAFVALRVPAPQWAPQALPWLEIGLAVALVMLPAPWLIAPAAFAVALMLAYWAVIARALRFAEPVTCNCFGRLGAHQVSGRTLVRNTLLVLAALIVLIGAIRGYSIPYFLTQMSRVEVGWVLLALLAAATATLSFGGAEPAPSTGPRAAGPVTRADQRSAGVTSSAAQGPTDENGAPHEDDDNEEQDYLRAPIPFGALYRPSGAKVTLRDLAREQAVLLVALSPGCGPCNRIGPELAGWQEQLSPLVQVHALFQCPDDPAAIPERNDLVEEMASDARPFAIYDIDGECSQLMEIHGNPGAVLLGADGRLAGGPVSGEHPVRMLVADVLDELREAHAFDLVAEHPVERDVAPSD